MDRPGRDRAGPQGRVDRRAPTTRQGRTQRGRLATWFFGGCRRGAIGGRRSSWFGDRRWSGFGGNGRLLGRVDRGMVLLFNRLGLGDGDLGAVVDRLRV
jgi:hypothetical protein